MNPPVEHPYFTQDTAGLIRLGDVVYTDYCLFGRSKGPRQRCRVVEVHPGRFCRTGVLVRLHPIHPIEKQTEKMLDNWPDLIDAGWCWYPEPFIH